jgi:hypothetical protein
LPSTNAFAAKTLRKLASGKRMAFFGRAWQSSQWPERRDRRSMRIRLISCFLGILSLTACTTRLIPEAEAVRVTQKAADVTGCKSLGFVKYDSRSGTGAAAENEMRNKVAVLGGNMLFKTNYVTGVAYLCGPAPK